MSSSPAYYDERHYGDIWSRDPGEIEYRELDRVGADGASASLSELADRLLDTLTTKLRARRGKEEGNETRGSGPDVGVTETAETTKTTSWTSDKSYWHARRRQRLVSAYRDDRRPWRVGREWRRRVVKLTGSQEEVIVDKVMRRLLRRLSHLEEELVDQLGGTNEVGR